MATSGFFFVNTKCYTEVHGHLAA